MLLDDVGRAEHYVHDMIGDLNNFAVGFTDWNIVLNTEVSRGVPEKQKTIVG